MPLPRHVAIPCKITPGVFSSERFFTVELADGTTHKGLSPLDFLWDASGKPLKNEQVAPAVEPSGFVAARVVDVLPGDQVAVEVPDGEVIAVRRDIIRERPTRIVPPGVGTSPEAKPSVPFRP
jgi:hypothetical protein